MFLLQKILLYITIPSCLAQTATISQTPQLIVSRPNRDIRMDCTQVTTDHGYMFWYHQGASRELMYMVSIIQGQDPIYDGNYNNQSVYEVGKNENKHIYLKIKSLTAQNEGVYYCAASAAETTQKVEFGQGTILSVLGEKEKQIEPKVRIFPPDKQEFIEHGLISVVCVASGFFPEHVRLTWYLNNEKIESLYQNVPKSDADNTYSTSSRLSLMESQYFNPDTKIRCEARFVGSDNSTSDEIDGELGCGVSKESYGRYMNQGKISYIMVLFKSGLYAVIVVAVIWRRKALSGSC